MMPGDVTFAPGSINRSEAAMSDTRQLATNVKGQVDELIARYMVIREEKALLESKLGELTALLDAKETEVQALEREIGTLKLAGAAASDGNSEQNKELRSRINELVREIDRCIALLNR
jgi:chromosome segregation ATPase